MSDNVSITPGSGNIVAADEVVDGTLGTVKVQYVKIMDGTIDGTAKAAVGANGIKTDGSGVTQPVSGTVGISNFPASQLVSQTPANLVISATAATGAAVTATLPAIASQFHYLALIEITKYFTVANAASATPLVVTTTNLPGSLAFTFGQPLGTIGNTDKVVFQPNSPLKSLVVNTATTIVCPATTGIIWRINVFYYSGA